MLVLLICTELLDALTGVGFTIGCKSLKDYIKIVGENTHVIIFQFTGIAHRGFFRILTHSLKKHIPMRLASDF